MIFNLWQSLLGNPDTNGCWFITAATGYSGDIKISDNGSDFFEVAIPINGKLESLDVPSGYNIWVNLDDLDLDLIEFTYATSCPEDESFSSSICSFCKSCSKVIFNRNAPLTLSSEGELLQFSDTDVRFRYTLQAYQQPNINLLNGSHIRVQSTELNLDVKWIIGQSPLNVLGFTDDVGGVWNQIKSYFNIGIINANSLRLGNYQFSFRKRDWALATNNYNAYNPQTGSQIQNNAKHVVFSFTAIQGPLQSNTDTATADKVKVDAFEDTSVEDYIFKPKGVGTWEAITSFTVKNCTADCVPAKLLTWFSHNQPTPCEQTGFTKPPSRIIEVKKIAQGATVESLVITNEASMVTQLNTLSGNYQFSYKPCSALPYSVFGMRGYNATYLVSRYMRELEDSLEHFILRYENGTENQNRTAKLTFDNIILF